MNFKLYISIILMFFVSVTSNAGNLDNYADIIARNVNLRFEDNLQSRVLNKLDIGTGVNILERSEKKQSIDGYRDYWYKIESNGQVGWCFGRYIARFNEGEQKIEKRATDYFNNSINVEDAIITLTAYTSLTGNKELIDMGLRRIIDKREENISNYYSDLKELEKEYMSKLEGENIFITPTKMLYPADEAFREKLNEIKSLGYNITFPEGDYNIAVDPNYYLNIFGPYITEAYRQYLTLQSVEVNNPSMEDAALIISWNELSDRLFDWDNFISSYPEFEDVDKARRYYRIYLYSYLSGIDNTPIFDYRSKTLEDEVKNSYQRYFSLYKGTDSTKIIKEYYTLLEENNYRLNEKTRKFRENLLQ